MTAVPRILVIRRRYLGDIVLLGSVLRNLRQHWPEARITLLAQPAYAPIALLHPDVNQIRVFPKRLGAWPGFLRTLRRESFTHVFDFDNSDKTALGWADAATSPVLEAWVRGDHPLQQERAALEAAMLRVGNAVPVDVVRLVGDYVHARPRRR